MMIVFNILRHNRSHHCRHCLCHSLQAQVGALIRPQLAVEHRQTARTLNNSRYSLLISHGDLNLSCPLWRTDINLAFLFHLGRGGNNCYFTGWLGSSCKGGGTSRFSWWADTVHCPSFFVSTSWKTWRSIYRKIYIINKIVTDIHS